MPLSMLDSLFMPSESRIKLVATCLKFKRSLTIVDWLLWLVVDCVVNRQETPRLRWRSTATSAISRLSFGGQRAHLVTKDAGDLHKRPVEWLVGWLAGESPLMVG